MNSEQNRIHQDNVTSERTTSDQATGKPTLRLIHNLARSGSTLMCKCLGCMKGVNLLSEIHPLAVQAFNPLDQAHQWFKLFTPEDVQRIQQTPLPFEAAIELIELRSRERGEALVIRDWAHLDFTGLPFLETPSYSLGLADILRPHFDLVQTATVRHPVDQWLSLRQLAILQESIANGKMSVGLFLRGYLEFARHCERIGFVRYEDFTREPERVMEDMCRRLQLPYDPGFIDRWHEYTKITGDVKSTRGGNEIRPLKRREVESELLASFEAEASYHEALELLGYTS